MTDLLLLLLLLLLWVIAIADQKWPNRLLKESSNETKHNFHRVYDADSIIDQTKTPGAGLFSCCC